MAATAVAAPVLHWAQARSGRADEEMRARFDAWDRWLSGQTQVHFAELERLAKFTRVPMAYLLLPQPPDERLPIPDFRGGRGPATAPSDGLLDTIYLNQNRQAWYEDYLVDMGATSPLPFVGSQRTSSPESAASVMTHALDFTVPDRPTLKTVAAVRGHLARKFEQLGGLVVLNSMVGNNTHRMLDLEEFRGFTLHSTSAPLVFVNSHDTIRGQVFSLLHEFAHVWRGESAVSGGGDPLAPTDAETERWCNSVAAEILVPHADLANRFDKQTNLTDELDRLASFYHCSTLVVLLRLRDVGLLPGVDVAAAYASELGRLLAIMVEAPQGGGGQFYNNQHSRIGATLSRAIVRETLSGKLPMTHALGLLSFRSIDVFDNYAEQLGER